MTAFLITNVAAWGVLGIFTTIGSTLHFKDGEHVGAGVTATIAMVSFVLAAWSAGLLGSLG